MANGKQKKSKKKLIIFGGIGLLVVLLVVIAFVSGGKDDIVAVQVEKAQKRTITQKVSATGTIDPEFKVVITPEVTGEIVDLPVKEGQKVKKGQLLISINPKQYIADKERDEANLMQVKANLAMREAELAKVKADYERVKELHKKGLSSDAELETAKSNYQSTEAQYQAAQANVKQMEATLKRTIEQLSKTSIYSPMDGTVSKLNVELGERVLGSGFSQGTDMMTVSDLNNMEAVVDVDENDVVLVQIGDTARVKVDAFRDKTFDGIVKQIGNSAQTSGAGTQEQVVNFEVKVKLLKPGTELRPGMSCTADIETDTKNNVVSVPIQSVTAREKKIEKEENDGVLVVKSNEKKKLDAEPEQIVFVVKNNKVQSVPVKTGISDDNYIQITKGLDGGETVVSGSYRAISRELHDGSNVRVEDQNMPFAKK